VDEDTPTALFKGSFSRRNADVQTRGETRRCIAP
jgi:hypothetical protein